MQVTRDSKMTMRIIAPMFASELVENFKNDSIKINLMNDIQEEVNYTV